MAVPRCIANSLWHRGQQSGDFLIYTTGFGELGAASYHKS